MINLNWGTLKDQMKTITKVQAVDPINGTQLTISNKTQEQAIFTETTNKIFNKK